MERRKHERFEFHMPVRLEYVMGNRLLSEESRFINVSVGGAFIPTMQRLEQGTQMAIRIRADSLDSLDFGHPLPKPAVILVSSEITRTLRDPLYPGGWCSGVRFIGPFRIAGADTHIGSRGANAPNRGKRGGRPAGDSQE